MSGSRNRYVPPHLRGRGGSSGSKSHGHSSIGNNVSGSQWKKFDNGNNNNGNRSGRTPYDDRRGFCNSHGGNSNDASATVGTSRWANVKRSAVESGTHANGSGPRWKDPIVRIKQDHQLAHVEAVFFGDSFVKLFGLLNDYSDTLQTPRRIEVQKYKASSAKGLCRDGNVNRAKIVKAINFIRRQHDLNAQQRNFNNKQPAYQHLKRLVFGFGSVDIHMSFYYKKFVEYQPLSEDDLKAIANNYVDFVAGLDTGKPLVKLIVGIYPSPLCDKNVGSSLLAYGSLESQEQVSAVDSSNDRFIELRQARVDLFNQTLKDRCDGHNSNGSNHGKLEYWDVREDILTHDEATGKPVVKGIYMDVSDLNIHLIHETTLQLWLAKWPWYEALTHKVNDERDRLRKHKTKCNSQLHFLEYLQKTFDAYRKTKPWAEGTHIAETQGVRLA